MKRKGNRDRLAGISRTWVHLIDFLSRLPPHFEEMRPLQFAVRLDSVTASLEPTIQFFSRFLRPLNSQLWLPLGKLVGHT